MSTSRGMVLVIALVMLVSMTLIMTASLYVSQLSKKSATAGQQQLQVAQKALAEHLAALNTSPVEAVDEFVVCPAEYAAWSDSVLRCKTLLLSTETYGPRGRFYSGYTSLVLQQSLTEEITADEFK
ncbi:SRPBCC family protein [Rheinheimera salexigens]|nr:SRPBCC family protein [Rheinheimera salexigens]